MLHSTKPQGDAREHTDIPRRLPLEARRDPLGNLPAGSRL